ncbi:MAG: TrkH family potassium uptake protein [Phycisphaerales bacterium]|nr:MAG: TrkH family potassium uptake protein [Phycisphaerales bacterium]
MNHRYVFSQLALLFLVLSLILFVMAGGFFGTHMFVEEYQIDPQARSALIISGAIGLIIGGLLWLFTRGGVKRLGRKEALLLVALSWILGAAYVALPFYLWANLHPDIVDHPFKSFTDCYFEAMSGLTTTGATILGGEGASIENIPRSLLLWRSLSHWLGGLGIVVLFVAVLPSLGVGARKLFRIETPGPQPRGLTPHIRETARVLAYIYLGLTLAAILLLRATAWLGLSEIGWFDSICHTFSMVSTGGLSTRDASIAHYNSWALELICLPFMLFAGINFAIFYLMVRGQWWKAWHDTELRVYLVLMGVCLIGIMAVMTGLPTIITTAGREIAMNPFENFRFSSFQMISLNTGTGYTTADYDPWPFLSRVLLVMLMFIGGCAGSTAGGIKVIRVWIVFKIIAANFEKSFRPNVIRPLRINNAVMDDEMKLSAVVYVMSFLILFALGAVFLRLLELGSEQGDFPTVLGASLATLGNIGPALYGVGAMENYAWFSPASKWIMSSLMLLGRLEVFTILVLLTPRFWRTD